MDTLYPHCAGIDVHKQTVVVCVRHHDGQRHARQQIRTFPTHTQALLQLSDWLAQEGVTHVAMESTGVYWKPVYNLLEGRFQLVLVNAQHIKQVPGRKTDIKDCAWIAQRLQHGLLKASFVPPSPQRELRELKPVAAGNASAGGLGSGAHERDIRGSTVSAVGEATWGEAGVGSGSSYAAGDHLPSAEAENDLQRVGGGLL
jgi:hypothetical protein